MRPRFTSILTSAVAVLLVSGLAACGGDDSGTPNDARVDAPRIDAAEADAAETDAPAIDAPSIDATSIDAPTDATPTSSEWIQIARAATPGSGLSLPIMGATVTYLKPQIGTPANDPAGFTIQASQTGPALMIAVDPATLTPVPVVGDTVSFTITTMASVGSQPRATAITGFARSAQGANVGALAQSVTAATDLVTALDSYDSEIVDVSGVVAGAFNAAGSSFEAAQVTTTGIGVASANFLLRIPVSLKNSVDVAQGCTFALDNTPIHRFTTQAQLTAFTAADIVLSGCPAPTVMSAVALTPTSVRITFTRNVLASSVLANGTQFTFDNGLTASAATVSGRDVTVTTSAQVGGTTYVATVANTVTDLLGTTLGTPNTATFNGFVTPAVVRINEVNANIASGCDLIELRVISAGNMAGYKVQERTGVNNASITELNFNFTNFNVQTNDIVVLHINGTSGTCNPGAAVNETTSITGQLAATFTRNYDTAYDWYASDSGLTATDNVITLYDATGAIIDAVLIDDDVLPTVATPSNVAANSETQAAACATANQWRMVGGGVPAGGFVDEDFRIHSVRNSIMTSTNNTGVTIQRIDNTDDNDMADWNASPGVMNSWGLINAGQVAF